MNKRIEGIKGEILAKNFLKQNRYKILESNYTTPVGEIDLIVQKKNLIVFVEVKERTSINFGFPREAVTPHKQNKIKQVATIYLKYNNLMQNEIRFDVVEILNDKIEHIQNAF